MARALALECARVRVRERETDREGRADLRTCAWIDIRPSVRPSTRPSARPSACQVALVGVQSYLKMLMMDNFIHADLHPGNVLVRIDAWRGVA